MGRRRPHGCEQLVCSVVQQVRGADCQWNRFWTGKENHDYKLELHYCFLCYSACCQNLSYMADRKRESQSQTFQSKVDPLFSGFSWECQMIKVLDTADFISQGQKVEAKSHGLLQRPTLNDFLLRFTSKCPSTSPDSQLDTQALTSGHLWDTQCLNYIGKSCYPQTAAFKSITCVSSY